MRPCSRAKSGRSATAESRIGGLTEVRVSARRALERRGGKRPSLRDSRDRLRPVRPQPRRRSSSESWTPQALRARRPRVVRLRDQAQGLGERARGPGVRAPLRSRAREGGGIVDVAGDPEARGGAGLEEERSEIHGSLSTTAPRGRRAGELVPPTSFFSRGRAQAWLAAPGRSRNPGAPTRGRGSLEGAQRGTPTEAAGRRGGGWRQGCGRRPPSPAAAPGATLPRGASRPARARHACGRQAWHGGAPGA